MCRIWLGKNDNSSAQLTSAAVHVESGVVDGDAGTDSVGHVGEVGVIRAGGGVEVNPVGVRVQVENEKV